MKQEDDFYGKSFTTKKGSTLTVVCCAGYRGKGVKLYKVECSVCSKDAELFPEEFIMCKSSLLRGSAPCGCSSSPKWNKNQFKIRLERRCEEVQYHFKGVRGNWKGANTKINLYNPVTENSWDSTIHRFLNLKRGDPVQARINTTNAVKKDRSVNIRDIMSTGKFPLETTFWESDESSESDYKVWKYICPVCSNDTYCEKGLCSGIFDNRLSLLKQGHKSCRCSPTYGWTKPQREFQLKRLLEVKGFTFTGWVEEDKFNSTSKVVWSCTKGHICTARITNILTGSYGCSYCANGNGKGYYPKRYMEQDFLYIAYVEGYKAEYYKIGRSFQPDVRLKQNQARINNFFQDTSHKITYRSLYTGSHQDVYSVEQSVVKNSNFIVPYNMGYGSTELILTEKIEDVYDIIEISNLKECDLKQKKS